MINFDLKYGKCFAGDFKKTKPDHAGSTCKVSAGLSWEGQARLADGRRRPRVQRPVHATQTALLNPFSLELCFHCDERQLIPTF